MATHVSVWSEQDKYEITLAELTENFGNGGLVFDHAAWQFTSTVVKSEREAWRLIRRQVLFTFIAE